jgi:hypothetical protein
MPCPDPVYRLIGDACVVVSLSNATGLRPILVYCHIHTQSHAGSDHQSSQHEPHNMGTTDLGRRVKKEGVFDFDCIPVFVGLQQVFIGEATFFFGRASGLNL